MFNPELRHKLDNFLQKHIWKRQGKDLSSSKFFSTFFFEHKNSVHIDIKFFCNKLKGSKKTRCWNVPNSHHNTGTNVILRCNLFQLSSSSSWTHILKKRFHERICWAGRWVSLVWVTRFYFVQKMKLLFWCGKEYKKVGDVKCQSL